MTSRAKALFALIKETLSEFSEDECMQTAAALSYYTVFSLPPLLVLLIVLLGSFMDTQQVQHLLQERLRGAVGGPAAGLGQVMMEHARRPGSGGPVTVVLGIAGLLFGATGAFVQLQKALNRAWDVRPDPERSGIVVMLIKRAFSLAMLVGVAALLLVSMVSSAALSAASEAIADALPAGLSGGFLWILHTAFSLAVITLLFAAVFKILPDAKVAARDVWIGAFVTAVLFVLGQFLIGAYLGHSHLGSAYGAAGSLALLLVWVYYSAMILLLGAELTQVRSAHRGRPIQPRSGAVWRDTEAPPSEAGDDQSTPDRRKP